MFACPNWRYLGICLSKGQAGQVLGKTLVWSMNIMYFDVFFQVRIDHRTRSLSFGTDLGVAQKEDVAEGPCLQSMPSEQIRNQLIHFSQALHQAVDLIQPKQIKVRHTPDFFLVLGFYRVAIKPNQLKAKQKPIPSLALIASNFYITYILFKSSWCLLQQIWGTTNDIVKSSRCGD